MRFNSDEEETRYRHSLMTLICIGDPTQSWSLVLPDQIVEERKKAPSAEKHDLDYYEKKLNEFKTIEV